MGSMDVLALKYPKFPERCVIMGKDTREEFRNYPYNDEREAEKDERIYRTTTDCRDAGRDGLQNGKIYR
jgi:hypothetical protein